MWFRFWRPDYFYVRHVRLIDAGDGSPFNRGWDQGFGFFVLTVRWNEGRSASNDGIHYPEPLPKRVTINGEDHAWSGGFISYEDVVRLAKQPAYASVTYHRAAWPKPDGCLVPGKAVIASRDPIKNTVFNAAVTGAA